MPLTGATLDHVAVAVDDAGAALEFWTSLGATKLFGGPSGVFRTETVMLGGGSKLELLSRDPDAPEGTFIDDFLTRYGSGLVHHVTIKVAGSLQQAIDALAEDGYDVVDASERVPGWHEAFLRPSVAGGLVVQIAWTDVDDDAYAERLGLPPLTRPAPGTPTLRALRLQHDDLPEAARFWEAVGASLEWSLDQRRFTASWPESRVAVEVVQGPGRGPLGLVVAGLDPARRTDLAPVLLAGR